MTLYTDRLYKCVYINIAIQDYLCGDRGLYPHSYSCVLFHSCYQINLRFFQMCYALILMSNQLVMVVKKLKHTQKTAFPTDLKFSCCYVQQVCVSLWFMVEKARFRLQTPTLSLCSGMLQCSAAPPAGGLWMTAAGEPQSSQAGPAKGV